VIPTQRTWPLGRGARIRPRLRRAAPTLLALVMALLGLLALVPRPAATAAPQTADYVIVAGAAGLRWDDVNAIDTPTMWRLAQSGSIGALSVRSARAVTCAGDGWLTLGTGNFARYTLGQVTPQCPALKVTIDQSSGPSATLPGVRNVIDDNRTLPWGAEPGALAEAVRCTSAIGPGAAIAAARPYGRIDRYSQTAAFDTACALSIVDLGTIAGDGPDRRDAVRQADAALAAVLVNRPERSLVVVAGLSDVDSTSRLHVAIAEGPGYAGGWLTSPTTGRPGYVQLVDLAPTVLTALDRPVPAKLLAGGAATRTAGRPANLGNAVGRLADADREASVQRHISGRFFGVLTIAQLLLFVMVVPLLRRARRPAGPVAPTPFPRRLVRSAEVLLVAAALAVPAALVADLVPWWRWRFPGVVFAVVTLAVLAAATAAVTMGTRRKRALAPLGWVAAAAAAAVAFDVLTGARLQLNGVAGYSALAGGRYAGVGVIGLGVLIAGVLLAAGALAQRTGRRWRPLVIAVVGALGVVLVGSPYLGADASGAVALSAGVCAAVAMGTGGWLTLSRFTWAVCAAFAVTVGFGVLDMSRPQEQRGSVGRFIGHLRDGTAGFLFQRIGEANFLTLVTSPLTVLVIGSALFAGFALLRTWGGLKRVLGLYPAVRAGLAGIVVATVFAGLVEAAAFNVLGAALATVSPLAALAALRVLDHADDKTQAAPEASGDAASRDAAVTASG
jgi:hypothetical protein